jgi:hypothetical protein
MSSFFQAIRNLVGNSSKTTILIGIFILILCGLAWRCSSAAEIDLRMGPSFGPGASGAVLGMQLYFPVGNQVDLYAGTLLWGSTPLAPNNWDWSAGFRTCRWKVCASLGASYLQRIDAVNGSHTNFNLELSYALGWKRLSSIDMSHLSDAGTTAVNKGRNAALVSIRLQ